MIENYGLSETLFVTARSAGTVAGTGYVGEVLPGIQLRVVAEDGSRWHRATMERFRF